MSSEDTVGRRWLYATTAIAFALTAVLVALLTPWHPLGAGAPAVHTDARSFTAAEVARLDAYHAALGPWPFVSMLAGALAPWAVWVLAHRLRHNKVRRRWLLVIVVVVGTELVRLVATLPMAVHTETVLRRFGLSTQSWGGWISDELLAVGLTVLLTALGVLALLWLVRHAPARWPYLAAAAAALLTIAGSAAYPVIAQAQTPLSPLANGPVASAIEQVAARDGLGRVPILVARASLRTTGENAQVSGLGATHRVILDDTVLRQESRHPKIVAAIVAHEFGHVLRHDVLRGTTMGAAAAASGVLLLGLVLTTRRGRKALDAKTFDRRAAVTTTTLVLAIAATGPYLVAPLGNLVSRRIEATADVHGLTAIRDPTAFARMQHDLAMSNLSRLYPTWWQDALIETHPSPPWRIGQVDAWRQMHR